MGRVTIAGNMYAEWLARYIEERGGVESVGWETFLSGMLRAPPEEIVVKKLIKSPRGGSGNNPYLKDRFGDILESASASEVLSLNLDNVVGVLRRETWSIFAVVAPPEPCDEKTPENQWHLASYVCDVLVNATFRVAQRTTYENFCW